MQCAGNGCTVPVLNANVNDASNVVGGVVYCASCARQLELGFPFQLTPQQETIYEKWARGGWNGA